MSAVDERQAFVTLAIRDSYGLGCVVLGHAIRNLRTNREIIVLVTDQVSNAVRDLLKGVFDEVITVPILDGTDPRIRRPDLSISLTKIECWNLIQYTKCVYLDPDTLILRNCDELFELDEFSASPDVGWPDCFNTGVFVFKPSKETYNKLITLAREQGSFDGGEHGLLNSFFGKDWRSSLTKRLSYVYNMVSGSIYTYAPAFKRFGDLSKIAHFGGHPKPWLANWHKDGASITAEYIDPSYHHPFLQTWLDVFWTNVYPRLPSVCNELTETGDTFTIWSLLSAMQSPQVYLMARKKPPPPPPPPLPPPPVVFEPWQPPPPLKVKMPSPELPRSPPRRPSSASIPVSQPDLFETYRPSQHAIVTPTPSYSDQIQLESRSLSASPVRPAGCCSPSQGRRHSVTSVDKTGPEFMSAKIIKSGVPSKTEMYDKRKSAPSFVPERETHFRPIELPPQSPEAIPSTSTTEDVGVVPEQPFSVPLGVKTESERKGKKPKAYFEEKLPESESVSLKQVKSNGRRVGTTTRVPFPSVETVSENVLRDRERMKDWEEGKVDYLGKDKFENIQKKLDALMADRRGRSKSASDEDEEELTSWRMDTSSVESSVSSTPDLEEIREEEFVPLRSLKSSEDQVVRRNTSGIPGSELGDYTGMRDWEQGNIDVDGRDNSDNIIKRLDFLINQPTSELVNKWKSK